LFKPVILALERLRQEDHDFKVNPGYMLSLMPAYSTQQDTI
jgi:hypothetical protein